MQKRVLLLILVLATAVSAGQNIGGEANQRAIPEYHDFPLDNIHILRLQDAARQLGGNVSLLKNDLAQYEAERAQEAQQLKSSVDSFEQRVMLQMQGMQAAIDEVAREVNEQPPPVQVPAPAEESNKQKYLMILLGVNVFLLLLVIILIFWLREQYHKKPKEGKKDENEFDEEQFEDHIHPAPMELVEYVKQELKKKKSLHDIRMELAGEGWTPSIIEHAVHAAREKR